MSLGVRSFHHLTPGPTSLRGARRRVKNQKSSSLESNQSLRPHALRHRPGSLGPGLKMLVLGQSATDGNRNASSPAKRTGAATALSTIRPRVSSGPSGHAFTPAAHAVRYSYRIWHRDEPQTGSSSKAEARSAIVGSSHGRCVRRIRVGSQSVTEVRVWQPGYHPIPGIPSPHRTSVPDLKRNLRIQSASTSSALCVLPASC